MEGIDINILIYALHKDFPEHKKSVSVFLEKIRNEQPLAVSCIIFMEVYHTLVHKVKIPANEVKNRLKALILSSNTLVLEITTKSILHALELAEIRNLGGRDALIAANYLENSISTIISHDKDFDNIPELKRIDPIR
jgi:predicted nucleic acid-binding protein